MSVTCIHCHLVGDRVTVELRTGELHSGLIVGRQGSHRYRVLFPPGNTLLVRSFDITANLTQLGINHEST